MTPPAACPWCGKAVVPKERQRGSQQRFCSDRCRHKLHDAARRWGLKQFDEGVITVVDLKAAG